MALSQSLMQSRISEAEEKENISRYSVLNLSWCIEVLTVPGITDGDFGEISFFGKYSLNIRDLIVVYLKFNQH